MRALLCASISLHDARLAATYFPESDPEEPDEPGDFDDLDNGDDLDGSDGADDPDDPNDAGDSQNVSDNGGTRAEAQQRNDDADSSDAAAGAATERPMPQRTHARSRRDWGHILHDGRLFISMASRDRMDTARIDVALRFIFSRQYSRLLSWGTRTIQTQIGLVELPAVTRRTTMEQISRDYETFRRWLRAATPAGLSVGQRSSRFCPASHLATALASPPSTTSLERS
jgi:hypothetical protein